MIILPVEVVILSYASSQTNDLLWYLENVLSFYSFISVTTKKWKQSLRVNSNNDSDFLSNMKGAGSCYKWLETRTKFK